MRAHREGSEISYKIILIGTVVDKIGEISERIEEGPSFLPDVEKALLVATIIIRCHKTQRIDEITWNKKLPNKVNTKNRHKQGCILFYAF